MVFDHTVRYRVGEEFGCLYTKFILTCLDLIGRLRHRFSKLKLTWWKRLIDCWVVMMFRPQGRKLAYWLGIMECRTFTYGQDSQDIQIHSLLWQRHQKSMTVKQTTARKNPKEWVIDFLVVSLWHSEPFMNEWIEGTLFFFLNWNSQTLSGSDLYHNRPTGRTGTWIFLRGRWHQTGT